MGMSMRDFSESNSKVGVSSVKEFWGKMTVTENYPFTFPSCASFTYCSD
jgi:hypothetical protein